jgi:predicted Fe-Mo cluster-binding NifX family protein
MKIAIVTDDFKTISAHFGRAMHYTVFTIENGQVSARESRDKAGHHQFAEHSLHSHHGLHGTDPASEDRHAAMMTTIADCQVLLACGMGAGAYNALKQRGINPIITDMHEIQAAVEAYLAGSLTDHPERLH